MARKQFQRFYGVTVPESNQSFNPDVAKTRLTITLRDTFFFYFTKFFDAKIFIILSHRYLKLSGNIRQGIYALRCPLSVFAQK